MLLPSGPLPSKGILDSSLMLKFEKYLSDVFCKLNIFFEEYSWFKNVKFLIGEKGKEKVRSEKQKNVHAYVTGTLVDYCEFPCDNMPTPETNTVIKYNPYFDETFLIKKTKEPIYRANDVQMINLEDKIFLVN